MRERGPAAPSAAWASPGAMTSAPGERLPQPPRERKPALAALAVLLILGGALGSATLVLRSGKTTSVIVLAKDVPAGAKLTTEDFREAEVSNADSGVTTVAWAQRTTVADYYAKVSLVAGSLLVSDMVSGQGAGGAGTLTIGVSLAAGDMPGGLVEGDRIRLYSTDPAMPAAQRILATATVTSLSSSTSSSTSDASVLTVIVDEDVAPLVLAQAKASTIAAALLPVGATAAATPPAAGPTTPAPATTTAPTTTGPATPTTKG